MGGPPNPESAAVIRITRETDYGIVLLARFALGTREGPRTASELAEESHLPLAMVAKILKRLTRGGILVSQRGVKGGYRLSRRPQEISVTDMISVLEGRIAVTECSDPNGACDQQCWCQVHPSWQVINDAILDALALINLEDMVRPLERLPLLSTVALHSLKNGVSGESVGFGKE